MVYEKMHIVLGDKIDSFGIEFQAQHNKFMSIQDSYYIYSYASCVGVTQLHNL